MQPCEPCFTWRERDGYALNRVRILTVGQGDQLHSAEDFISATYGLPPAYIFAKSKSKG